MEDVGVKKSLFVTLETILKNQKESNRKRGFGATPKDTITFLIKFIRFLLEEENI